MMVAALMFIGLAAQAQEVTRSVYGLNSYGRSTLADTVIAVEFRSIQDDVDLNVGFKSDNTSLLIVQGGYVYGDWTALDSIAISTSQGTAAYGSTTVTNLPPFVRIKLEAADTTSQLIQWRGIKQ